MLEPATNGARGRRAPRRSICDRATWAGQDRDELRDIYHPVIAGVRRLPKPMVAAVNGPAVGIGCSLAPACDLTTAESAFFGCAFVNIGLMPEGGSTALVPPAVGRARAFQIALLGERIPRRRRSSGAWSTGWVPTIA